MAVQLSELLLAMPMDHADISVIEIAVDGKAQIPRGRRVHCHLVLAGHVNARVNGSDRPLNAGDFLMLERGTTYTLRCTDAGEYFVFGASTPSIRRDMIDHIRIGRSSSTGAILLSAAMGIDTSPRSLPSAMPAILQFSGAELCLPVLGTIGSHSGAPSTLDLCEGPGGRAFAAAILNLLYVHAVRSVHADVVAGRTLEEHLRQRHLGIEAALRIIHRRFCEPWTVRSLAETVCMSRSAFAAAFRDVTGETPLGYIARLRLAEATMLLAANDGRSVGEIAGAVGYRSQAAFTRAFKSRYGTAPGRYRRSVSPVPRRS